MSAHRALSQSARRLLNGTKSLAVAVAIFLVLRTFVFQAFHIYPSGSMEQTLLIQDFLFVNKALYGAEIPVVHKRMPAIRAPARADIVIFNSVEQPGLTLVKRIVGMPGDTLAMRHDTLVVDGRAVREPYAYRSEPFTDRADPQMRQWQLPHLAGGVVPASYRPTLATWGPLIVPADSYFVMGDNRHDSYDSRFWGFVGRDRIEGHPWIIYYSYDPDGLLPLPFLTAIRWKRLFSLPR